MEAVMDQAAMILLSLSAACGAVGGVVYELIVLQGNIEWPHRPTGDEMPEGGYVFANAKHLYDLGIIARLIVGAAAALAIYWVIPAEQGLKFFAVSVVAGSAGTAVFRSLQDRLLSALNASKVNTLGKGLEGVLKGLEGLDERAMAERGPAGQPHTEIQTKVAAIRGSVQTLMKIAGRG